MHIVSDGGKRNGLLRKYDVYMKMKQEYIDKATNDYKYLCYTINGSSHITGQCAITKDMNTINEVMCAEHITELQGGMNVL